MSEKKQINDQQFAKLLDLFNLSWQGYKKVRKGVKKRISRHIQKLGCQNVDQYFSIISSDPVEIKTCRKHLTVSISRFFRDRQLWKVLQEKILPNLIAKAQNSGCKKTFRVWSCGCARGEEAYSFNILWEKLMKERKWVGNNAKQIPELKIWATDMNPEYIESAKKGAYEYSSLKELPFDCIEKYFNKVTGKNRYLIKSRLKFRITFEQNNILKDPTPSKNFSVVFLRNSLLTYYQSPEKENTLSRITNSLKSGGVLIIGSHEKLPSGFDFMVASACGPWIFYKRRP